MEKNRISLEPVNKDNDTVEYWKEVAQIYKERGDELKLLLDKSIKLIDEANGKGGV